MKPPLPEHKDPKREPVIPESVCLQRLRLGRTRNMLRPMDRKTGEHKFPSLKHLPRVENR